MNEQRAANQGTELVRRGKELISYIARARVCMPKSTAELIGRCRQYRTEYVAMMGTSDAVMGMLDGSKGLTASLRGI